MLRILFGIVFAALPMMGTTLLGWLLLESAKYQWWGWAISLVLVLLSGFLARPIFRTVQTDGSLFFLTAIHTTPEWDVTEDELKKKEAAHLSRKMAQKNRRKP